ncbi:MAG: hypothetical protein HYU41_16750 [Candidatus Rokubacteria bacterium]|nr:hypothetical protein [Candidatus Rokubacteria bacterium]
MIRGFARGWLLAVIALAQLVATTGAIADVRLAVRFDACEVPSLALGETPSGRRTGVDGTAVELDPGSGGDSGALASNPAHEPACEAVRPQVDGSFRARAHSHGLSDPRLPDHDGRGPPAAHRIAVTAASRNG